MYNRVFSQGTCEYSGVFGCFCLVLNAVSCCRPVCYRVTDIYIYILLILTPQRKNLERSTQPSQSEILSSLQESSNLSVVTFTQLKQMCHGLNMLMVPGFNSCAEKSFPPLWADRPTMTHPLKKKKKEQSRTSRDCRRLKFVMSQTKL